MNNIAEMMRICRPVVRALRDRSVLLDDAVRAAKDCGYDLSRAVEAAVDAAAEDDRVRRWALSDGQGGEVVQYTSTSLAAAEGLAQREIETLESAYADGASTVWVDWYLHCPTTGERGEYESVVHPTEPPCVLGEHAWVEGPVRGHGGGIVQVDKCACGCERTYNSWASRPDNGVQGYTTWTYSTWE